MSQIVTRKGPVKEDKEKRQTDSPVKEMKKKIAANAEKEKQAAEKNVEKSVQNDKKQDKTKEKEQVEKVVEKSLDKKDKPEKSTEKNVEKKDKVEKSDKKDTSDKKDSKEDKPVEKKEKEKPAEKKEAQPEKSGENSKEKIAKADTPDDKQTTKKQTADQPKAKENGAKLNGEQNGGDNAVSSDEDLRDSDVDVERDEMFPELAYEDSDGEFEPPTPEGLPSRSYTRRSQVKATRTPETPRPPSKHTDKDYVPDDLKLLKLKDDTPMSDRKLRSADSPKPQDKKIDKVQENKKCESPKKDTLKAVQEEQKEDSEKDNVEQRSEVEIEVVVEVENEDDARLKPDTNYSRSRVKVSPYRRSAIARAEPDVSMLANYTGNNTTMEMDITESSSFVTEETPESPYLSGLRSIRGRKSYKPLKEMNLRNISINRSTRSVASVPEHPSRPTGTVVGRKRKPDSEADLEVEEVIEVAVEAEERRGGKRARLLDRLARPFRATMPLVARRNAEIVGINTDLPLSVPIASTEPLDPETIKPPTPHTPQTPPTPPSFTSGPERDSKRCIVM